MPALEELKACKGEEVLVFNTSQILISSLCALMILLKHKSDLVSAQIPQKWSICTYKFTYLKPTRLSEVATQWLLGYIRHAMFCLAHSVFNKFQHLMIRR